MGRCFCLSLL